MSNFDHVSDLVQAREKIQNLIERLDAAKADVDKWKMEFDVTVQPRDDTFELKVIAKVGSRATTVVIQQHEVVSFKGDFDTLTNIMVGRVMHDLLKEQVKQELAPAFEQACENVVKLSSRSSL